MGYFLFLKSFNTIKKVSHNKWLCGLYLDWFCFIRIIIFIKLMIEYRPVIVGKKKILRIDVPAADRHDKPVYIGTDPMKGTYKRDYEGDFLCTEEAVQAMFADQRDISGDVEVLDEFGLDVLNQDTML